MKASSIILLLVLAQQLNVGLAFHQRRASKLEMMSHAEAESATSFEQSLMLGTALKAQMSIGLSSAASLRRMEGLMDNMTVDTAVEVLRENGGLPKAVSMVLEKSKQENKLRKPSGYGAVEGVINMLNNMTDEAEKKLDMENVRCSDYEKNQLEQIEGTRQDISMYDAQSAKARAEVLGASTEITLISTKLPKLKSSLGEHKSICERDLTNGENQLAIVENDIRVMTKVVQMSNCDKNLFLLQCRGHKTTQSLLASKAKMQRRQKTVSLVSMSTGESSSESGSLKGILDELRSPYTKRLLREELRALYRQTKSTESPAPVSFLEQTTDLEIQHTQPKGPVKATDDPPKKKAQSKCSIKDNPNCQHMRDKFLQILSGIVDKADAMKRDLQKIRGHCQFGALNLEAQIGDHETRFKEQQSELARATKELNEASGQSRMKQIELSTLMSDYGKTMAVCRINTRKYESEICGLKKIRTEVLKIEGVDVFIIDCTMSAWSPEECTKSCGGGTQTLKRTITQFPDGGAPCQPKEMVQACNTQGCPVNCKMKKWSGWSTCSAKCGGGVKSRNRGIKVEPKNGGVPCEETSQADTCNAQSCDRNCKLKKWTKWSKCSKVCGGGLIHRTRGVKRKAVGGGTCPKANAKMTRLQYKHCNNFECPTPPVKGEVTKCVAKLDVVILLDGSGSLGEDGWKASLNAAQMLVKGFDTSNEDEDKPSDSRVAMLLFGGPRTWDDLHLCTEGPKEGQKPPDLKKNCGIEWISKSEDKSNHFATDIDGLAKDIKRLKWPASTTLTSVALLTANDELKYGRKDAQSIVIVITDGRPMSPGKTFEAARKVRSKGRLMFVPVTQLAPIKDIKHWASKPTSENMLQVKDFASFEQPKTISKIVQTLCPKVYMPPTYVKDLMAKNKLR